MGNLSSSNGDGGNELESCSLGDLNLGARKNSKDMDKTYPPEKSSAR